MRSNPPGLVHTSQVDDPEVTVLDARNLWDQGERDRALVLLRGSVQRNSTHLAAWRLLAELTPGIEEKIMACESILRMDPADESAKISLSEYRHFQEAPEEWADYLEERGLVEAAISVNKELARRATDTAAFDRFYHKIIRLENLQLENIKYVNPLLSVFRLSLGMPILYALLVLMQSGFKPIENAPLISLVGLPVVAIGSFLTAISTMRSPQLVLGNKIKMSGKEGLSAVRILMSLSGWLLMIFPFALMVVSALIRLHAFIIPPLPLFN